MSTEGFLGQAFVFLAAAVLAVPVAQRLGLGSVLGYLLAGVAIGPFGLSLLGAPGQDVMHAAEFGVVIMLFVVGLELEPSRLWRLRAPILGMGGLQVALTTLALAALGLLAGLPWQAAVAVGLALSLSSTAIALQTLTEKGLLKTAGGQGSFAVLLFQDIAVIPILAVFPLLATGAGAAAPPAGRARGRHLDLWPARLGTDAGRARGGRGDGARRALPGAARVPGDRAHAPARGLHGGRAAARDRHRAAHDAGRPQPGARYLPGRGGARE